MSGAPNRQAGIVVIGAGEAGLRAALTLRENDYEGSVTVVGAEPHTPYERPPLSKQLLLDRDCARPPIPGIEGLANKQIALHTGVAALAIDRQRQSVSLSNGHALRYERLLIATGACARPLLIEGGDLALSLRRIDDAIAIRDALDRFDSLLVIGGGFIGLEVAAAARQRGLKVTVAEAAHRILERATPESVAAIAAGWHEEAGVEIRTGKTLKRISTHPRGFEAEFDDGDGLLADLVVAGVGATPETRLAGDASLALDNGIAVDGRLRTSDPFIYAAGDCASFPHPLFDSRRLRLEAWRNAQDQGAFAARSLLGDVADYDAVPWFWSDQYDATLQVAGLPSLGSQIAPRRLGVGALLTFHLDASGRLVGAAGAGPLESVAGNVRIAEKMIAQRMTPDPNALADPKASLKAILRGNMDIAARRAADPTTDLLR